MCGIMGYTGPRRVVDVVVGGLEYLEYRGYDSAGIAVAGPKGLGATSTTASTPAGACATGAASARAARVREYIII